MSFVDTPEALGAQPVGAQPVGNRYNFALGILGGLNAPPTANNVQALLAWMERENTRAQNNPLATTKPGFNSTGVLNDHNVRHYPTMDDGIAATVATMKLGYYRDVVALLRSGTAEVVDISRAVGRSPWGTGTFHHYSGTSGNTLLGHPTDSDSLAPAYTPDYDNFGTNFSGTKDRPNDLDLLVQTAFPEGVPENVQFNDLPDQLKTAVLEELGWRTVWLSHPELGPIILYGSLTGMTEDALEDKVQGTEWFQTNSKKARDWENLNYNDPAEANRVRQTLGLGIQQEADSLGVVLSQDKFQELIEEAARFGWDDVEITNALVGEFYFDANQKALTGDINTYARELQQTALSYGITYSDEDAFGKAQEIAMGTQEAEDLTPFFVDQAKARYSWFADEFDKGLNLDQITYSRREQIADLMGISATEVDFVNDERFAPVIEFTDSDGKTRAMNSAETRNYLTRLDDYAFTDDARQRTSDLAFALLKEFGAI